MAQLLHYAMEKFIEHAWPVIYRDLLKPEKRRWSFFLNTGASDLRIFEMAGRVILTFRLDADDVTYITDDRDATGEHFGLQGYEGRYWTHNDAIEHATSHVKLFGTKKFKYSTKQTIG